MRVIEALIVESVCSPVCWTKVEKPQILCPELIQETIEKIIQSQARKQAALFDRRVTPIRSVNLLLEKVGEVAYNQSYIRAKAGFHNTFHVSNLKKCYADEPLAISLDGLHFDDKLQFVEEPIEIMDREVKRLKRSRIPLVKVRWNSKQGLEFYVGMYILASLSKGSVSLIGIVDDPYEQDDFQASPSIATPMLILTPPKMPGLIAVFVSSVLEKPIEASGCFVLSVLSLSVDKLVDCILVVESSAPWCKKGWRTQGDLCSAVLFCLYNSRYTTLFRTVGVLLIWLLLINGSILDRVVQRTVAFAVNSDQLT
ncbi:hypothetical protein Tco_0019118 [Tanacetum coccineum]